MPVDDDELLRAAGRDARADAAVEKREAKQLSTPFGHSVDDTVARPESVRATRTQRLAADPLGRRDGTDGLHICQSDERGITPRRYGSMTDVTSSR